MPTFRIFGLDHLAVIGFVILAGYLLLTNRNVLRRIGDDRWIRYPWALGLIAIELATWVFFARRGLYRLPLQLCDWALFLTAWSFLGANRLVTELAFFWGLAASSQAVLTPDLKEGFPSFSWLSFFLSHSAVILGVLYLLGRGTVSVTRISPWRVWFITNVYVALVGLVNWRLGTNFAYLARKPEQPSLLDYLGPWPYYIISSELVALALFFLCYLFAKTVSVRKI